VDWTTVALAIIAAVIAPTVLHILAAKRLKADRAYTNASLEKITTLVDGTQTTLMQERVDGLRRELVLMKAANGREASQAAINVMEEKITTTQAELDARLKQVHLAEKQEDADGSTVVR
jgi:hypothetical protein